MAISAGIDIVLMPADLGEAYKALLNGVQDGRIQEAQVDESLKRILSLKYDKGLL